MSDDMFDGMITTGTANTLFEAADMFGRNSANNRALQEASASRQGDLYNFLNQQDMRSLERQDQFRQERRMDLVGQRDIDARREENAFQRLNNSLDQQLKMTELESADRQRAFENTLRLEQNALQTKIQTMQIRQLEGAQDAQAFNGDMAALKIKSAGKPGLLADGLDDLLSRHQAGIAHLETVNPGFADKMAGMKQLAEQLKLDMPDIDDDLLDSFSVGKARKVAAGMDWRKPVGKASHNEIQVVAHYSDELLAGLDQDAVVGLADARLVNQNGLSKLAGLEMDKDGKPIRTDAVNRRAALVSVLEQKRAASNGSLAPEYQNLYDQLTDPISGAKYDALYDSGALRVVKDKGTLVKLQTAHDQYFRSQAELMELASDAGIPFYDPSMKELRQKYEDSFELSKVEILAGGDPNASWALSGGLTSARPLVDLAIEDIKKDELAGSLTGGDWKDFILEVSGLAGSGRMISNVARGRWDQLSWGDAVDLGLTAATVFSLGGSAAVTGGVKGTQAGIKGMQVGMAGGRLLGPSSAAAGVGRGLQSAAKFGVRRLGRFAPQSARAWAQAGSAGTQMIGRTGAIGTRLTQAASAADDAVRAATTGALKTELTRNAAAIAKVQEEYRAANAALKTLRDPTKIGNALVRGHAEREMAKALARREAADVALRAASQVGVPRAARLSAAAAAGAIPEGAVIDGALKAAMTGIEPLRSAATGASKIAATALSNQQMAANLRRLERVGNVGAGVWAGARVADTVAGRLSGPSQGYNSNPWGGGQTDTPRFSYGRLYDAGAELEDKLQALKLLGNNVPPKALEGMLVDFVSSFNNFRDVSASYYGKGMPSEHAEKRILQIRHLLPPLVARRFEAIVRNGSLGEETKTINSASDLRAMAAARQAPAGQPFLQTGAQALAPAGTGMNDLFNPQQ